MIENSTWTEAQDKDFIEALRTTQEIISQLSGTVYVMVDYLEQYHTAIRSLPLFTTEDTPSDDNGYTQPTQTNRASRRRAERATRK